MKFCALEKVSVSKSLLQRAPVVVAVTSAFVLDARDMTNAIATFFHMVSRATRSWFW